MTKSLEDYLETIGNLAEKNQVPRVKDIADTLKLSKPSVHTALHGLAERGMITHEHYGAIVLTEKGKEQFRIIKHKHDTLCRYLIEILNVSPENAEQDACAMEHILSDETFSKIEAQLNK